MPADAPIEATIRDAGADQDAAACASIYAPYVSDTVATFEYDPPSATEMSARIAASHVWLIAERDGAVVGYAYASPHRERAAYQWAADVAVYIDAAHRGSGLGRALYSELVERVRAVGLWSLCAGITQPNPASNGLHRAFGFEPVGTYKRIGWKAGAWHDVQWWQLDLRPGELQSPAALGDLSGPLQGSDPFATDRGMRHPPQTREQEFRAVYDTHGPAVYAYIARRVPREHVDDLASETFMVAWRKLPVRVDEPLSWLYAVARRVVLAHRRRLLGRNRLMERLAALAPRHDGVLMAVPEPVLSTELANAFARLTDNEKEALLLVAWEGLDHAQAGRVVGCTANTFTVRVSRARSKLRAALEPDQPSVSLSTSLTKEHAA